MCTFWEWFLLIMVFTLGQWSNSVKGQQVCLTHFNLDVCGIVAIAGVTHKSQLVHQNNGFRWLVSVFALLAVPCESRDQCQSRTEGNTQVFVQVWGNAHRVLVAFASSLGWQHHVKNSGASVAQEVQAGDRDCVRLAKIWQTTYCTYSGEHQHHPRHDSRRWITQHLWNVSPHWHFPPDHPEDCETRLAFEKEMCQVCAEGVVWASEMDKESHLWGKHWVPVLQRWSRWLHEACHYGQWNMGLNLWIWNKILIFCVGQKWCSKAQSSEACARTIQDHDDSIFWLWWSCSLWIPWERWEGDSRTLCGNSQQAKRSDPLKETWTVEGEEFLVASRQCQSPHRWLDHQKTAWMEDSNLAPPTLFTRLCSLWLQTFSGHEERTPQEKVPNHRCSPSWMPTCPEGQNWQVCVLWCHPQNGLTLAEMCSGQWWLFWRWQSPNCPSVWMPGLIFCFINILTLYSIEFRRPGCRPNFHMSSSSTTSKVTFLNCDTVVVLSLNCTLMQK